MPGETEKEQHLFYMSLVKNSQQSQQFYSKILPDRISHHYKLGVYHEKLNH